MDYPGMTVRRHPQAQTHNIQPQQHNHHHHQINHSGEKLSPQYHNDNSSAMILFPNQCSTSAPFLHFPGPPDYPPEHNAYRKLNNRYPDDLDTIEVYVEDQDECRYSYRGRKSGRNQKSRDAQVKWSRNNIAATMEKFEPISSPTTEKCQTLPSSHFHHDYSYAYYEPGAAMRHSNIPPPRNDHHPPPPNSIRALLSKRNPNLSTSSTPAKSSSSSSQHENPYEEIIGTGKGWKQMDNNSLDSINQNIFKEEFKHVQNLHRRVLGELDLSVEAMIMPTLNDNGPEISSEEPVDNLAEMMSSVVSTEELLSPSNLGACGGGDIDSGFSGSSSGASYVGSLRYHRRGSGGGGCSSMYGSSSRSSQRSQDDSGIMSFQNRSGSIYNGNFKTNSDGNFIAGPVGTGQDPKLAKSSFWKKGWKKFPSLTSNSSSNSNNSTPPSSAVSSSAVKHATVVNDNQTERTPLDQKRPQKLFYLKDYLNIVF